MQPIEHVPIFFKTDDARINAFLAKNRLHKEFCVTPTLRRKPLALSMARKGGNGNIRRFLVLSAVAALYLVCAAYAWGYIQW